MEITLVSDQLFFEEGDVYVAWISSSDALPSPVGTARLHSNAIDGLDIATAGVLVAIIRACTVRFLESGHRRHFSFVALTGEISSADVIRGRCDLKVRRFAIARIDVVDSDGNRLDDVPATGLAADGMTFEFPGTELAPLDLLVAPGEYVAYIRDQPATARAFSVRDGDVDAIITLRKPPLVA